MRAKSRYVCRKNIEVSHKGKYLFTWPSLTAYTNKERDYFEANYPEFGSRRKLGMFIGPGFVFGGPAGSVMKVIPFLNYQHGNFGFGGALKYRNTFNSTELGYGSAADIFFLKVFNVWTIICTCNIPQIRSWMNGSWVQECRNIWQKYTMTKLMVSKIS